MRIFRFKIRYVIYTVHTIAIFIIIERILFANSFCGCKNEVYLLNKTDNHEKNGSYEQWISEYIEGISPELGDYGRPAYLSGEEKIKGKKSLKKKAINVVLSNKIPLQRKLLDARDPKCKNISYDNTLPTASIIIIFHNEAFSVLLRTIYSVLKETPPKFLKEIILIDDKSYEEELQGLLEYYIQTRLPKKVKLLRSKERLGLTQARLKGAKSATGDVLVFLDAHCEVIKQWLEPLLQRIKEKHDAVLTPIIDIISKDTFEYVYHADPSIFQVGGFTWSGHFTWINIQKNDLKSRVSSISPVNSPTMAGGLFAIDRTYFWKIGGYDDKMEGWGGENLEISFRIWQCNGTLETIPCSRVGHVFRSFLPYKIPMGKDTHGINTARLANVWMDDYKSLYYLHHPQLKDRPELIGDIKERLNLREKLKCKSFEWYLDNIYPEKFIPNKNVQAYGRVRVPSRNLCLDHLQREGQIPYNLGVYECHPQLYMSQYLSLTKTGELRREWVCATAEADKNSKNIFKVRMKACEEIQNEKQWMLSEDGKILNLRTGLCLDSTGLHPTADVIATACSESPYQFWQFDFYGDRMNPR